MRRRETPLKRRYPSGEVVWLARYTGRDGKRRMAKPAWNSGRGTFDRKAEAQRAIDEAYGISDQPDTLGEYFAIWTERHPRSERTNATNEHRISRLTDVPVPATLAWMLEAQINLNGPDCDLIFTTPRGRLWRERNFYRDVWKPTQETSGLDLRPHECRHSYVTHLRAAGISDSDLAEIAGHRLETMLAWYAHPLGMSFPAVRRAIG